MVVVIPSKSICLDFNSASETVANWCSKEPTNIVKVPQAKDIILFTVPKLSSKDQLFFYSRYKQAHDGDNNNPRPPKTDFRACAKHDAWLAVRGMSAEVMKKEYVERVQEILEQHVEAQGEFTTFLKPFNKISDKMISYNASIKEYFKFLHLGHAQMNLEPQRIDLRDQIILSTMDMVGLEDDPDNGPMTRILRLTEHLQSNNIFPFYVPTRKITATTTEVDIGGGVFKECRVFSSYSYLGLIDHPTLLDASIKAIQEYGVGAHGARVLAGNCVIHQQLERKIASFSGKQAALVFSSGYMANIGVIVTLCRPGDYILLDKKAHRSLQDACILSKANILKFPNNDFVYCEKLFKNGTIPSAEERAAKKSKIFLISDSVFSMDGHLFPLPQGHAFCKKHGVTLVLDECHGLGVIGKTGRGIEEHFNMPGTVDVITGTLSKSIPASGGYVACSRVMQEYISMYGNPLIFSGPLAPSQAAVALEALNILESCPQIVTNLQENARYFKRQLVKNGYNVGLTETGVIPLILGEETKVLEIWRGLLDNGFFTSAVTAPAVAIGQARLRLIAHAGMEKKDIDDFVDTLVKLNGSKKPIGKDFVLL